MNDYKYKYHKYHKYKKKYIDLKNGISDKSNLPMINNYPKYYVFSGDQYYPLGGWEDLFGTAESLEEAKILYKKGFNTFGIR